MSKKIVHVQRSKNASTSECNLCEHGRVCRMLQTMENLDLPYPFTVEFECKSYK